MKSSYLQKALAGRNGTPTLVGIRHQIGLLGETYWLTEVTKWLDKRVKKGNKVMLEIPEYPLGDTFRIGVPSRVRSYMNGLINHLKQKGVEIIPGEDRERWGIDNSYHGEHVRDDEVFIPKMREIKPRFFLVGCEHLDYLKEKMPEFNYVNLVNEERDRKRCSWLNIDLSQKI